MRLHLEFTGPCPQADLIAGIDPLLGVSGQPLIVDKGAIGAA